MEASENLAGVYYVSKQPEKACEIYSTLYKKYPSAFKDYVNYGMVLYDTKQYKAATEILSKALTDNPENEAVIAKLALSYQNLGENDKSLEYFKKVFELNPNLTVLKFDYANLLGNMGQNDEAIKLYKDYLKQFPNDANAYKNLGLVYKRANDNDLALFNLEKSYSINPADNETKKELALCYHKKQDYINALKYYNLALIADPDNYELLANKALTLHAMNNYVSAIELYKQLLEKKPNDRLQENLAAATIAYGYSLYDKQDYGQAIIYFEDAIELAPKEASAYFGYAKANEKLGCIDIAMENYKKAISLAPDNIEYNSALTTLTNSQKIEEAKDANTSPTQAEVAVNYDTLIKKGDEAYKLQKYEEAIDAYTKAVVYVPQDKITMMKIANIYKLIGNTTKAISFYDKILTLDPNNADVSFNKGLALATQKNYDGAIKCFEKVIQLTPNNPYAYYSLGMAYEQKGDTDKALEYYYLYSGLENDEKMQKVIDQKIKTLGG